MRIITILLLAVSKTASSVHLHTKPAHVSSRSANPYIIHLSNPYEQFRSIIRKALPAERLPVQGFGFSNPPQPLGAGQDPATLTCGLTPPFCTKSRYRSLDGSCNNLARPAWGMSQTPYGRIVPYNYADGVHAWPRAKSGRSLPNSRGISVQLFPDRHLVDPIWNLNVQPWGQIITHDMSHADGVPQTGKDPVRCCNDYIGKLTIHATTNPACSPILVPPNDPVYGPQGVECINFVRTGTTRDRGCTAPNTPAEPISTVTAYMDLSLVYGSSAGQANPIRLFQGGRLLSLLRRGRDWPPQDPKIATTCEYGQSLSRPCYLTGDLRANQNPQLAIYQVVLMREHNRIADFLREVNPHWDDETLYQEARRIQIAQIQHITYYEYLPIILGFKNMVKNKLIYPRVHGYVNDYDPNVDPSVLDEHATAAFRHFHTLIQGYLKLLSANHALVGTVRMSDWLNRPSLLEVNDSFNNLLRGLTVQEQHFSDQFWDSEMTQFLFKRNKTYGKDLRAIDIQRGRDHGLGSYADTRGACGFSVPKRFKDMLDFISVENVEVLQNLYESPEDVELVVAGSLERNVPGTLAGPTFLCILTEQFYRTRVGDRYFYENGADRDVAFTRSQLQTIREGSSMARLLCDNAEGLETMQPKAFQQITAGNNPVRCDDLPFVDLTLWTDASRHYKI